MEAENSAVRSAQRRAVSAVRPGPRPAAQLSPAEPARQHADESPSAAEGRHHSRVYDLARSLQENEPSLKLSLAVRLLMTVLPILGFGIILATAYIIGGTAAWAVTSGAALGSFVGGGKLVIFLGVPQAAPVSVWALAALVVYGDIATMFVMMANMYFLYQVPFLGRRLAHLHEASWRVLHANPWMRRTAWLGIAVFVAAPLQGTGAVAGTILARLLGLSRMSTATAMAFGSGLGCALLALAGTYCRARAAQLAEHPWLLALGAAVMLALLVVLGRRFVGAGVNRGATPDQDPRRYRDIA